MAGLIHATPTEFERIATGMTARKYFALPEDHPRCELISGELWMPPSPNFRHQDAVFAIARRLADYFDANKIGRVAISPMDLQLDDDTVVQPDVMVLSPDHPTVQEGLGSVGPPPPLLVVEVLSPGSVAHDRDRKFRAYESAGVPAYWIVDLSARRLEIWLLDSDGRYRLDSVAAQGETIKAKPFGELALEMNKLFPPESVQK